MAPYIVDISPREESDARSKFHGSDFQKFIHNDLVKRINENRTMLEVADISDVPKIQAAIAELKTLVEIIHANDSESIKKIYG